MYSWVCIPLCCGASTRKQMCDIFPLHTFAETPGSGKLFQLMFLLFSMTPLRSINLWFCLICTVLQPLVAQTFSFSGKIANTHAIHLRLQRKGNTLSGGYYYDKVGSVLLLSGTIDSKNSVTLKEQDEHRHTTGTFSGSIKGNDFSGTWKGKYNKSMTFTLSRDTSTSFSRTYTGSINNRYRVQMMLMRKGNELSGMYYYERTGLDIPLRGTLRSDDTFVMDEFTEDGAKQATFTGRINADYSLSGTWAKEANNSMPFNLSLNQQMLRRVKEFSNKGCVEVFSRIRTETSKNKKSTLSIEYPQIRGMKDYALQQQVNKLFLPPRELRVQDEDESTTEQSFDVPCNSDSILSIRQYLYWYNAGAAHPNHATAGTHIDLRTAKAFSFKDVFRSTSYKALAKLAEKKILTAFEAQKLEDILFESSLVLGDSTDMFITTAGITLNFDPYEIAAYAAGDINVEFTWDEIADFIKPDSPVWQLMQKHR